MTLALKQADDNFGASASTIKTPAIQEEAKSTLSSMKDDIEWQIDKALLQTRTLTTPPPTSPSPKSTAQPSPSPPSAEKWSYSTSGTNTAPIA